VAEQNSVTEIAKLKYSSFPEIFRALRNMADQYGTMPMDALLGVFGSVFGRGYDYAGQDPYTQNRRVKSISTRPANYSKNQIAAMIQNPDGNEQPLRAVEQALEYSAYPLFHTRTVYQNLLTYHSYIAPHLSDKEDAKKDDFWREWKLLEKLRKKLNPKDTCHMIAGQALKEGKVFYHPRIRVDKAHNKIEHAFLQQMPSDFIKIVGFNNISKYTVAFNLMYFMMPGTDVRQFPFLEPYMLDFYDALILPEGLGKRVVYAQKAAIDLNKVKAAKNPDVEAYFQGGRWCYWVTLPVDAVFPFEIDDTDRNVLPVFTGIFLDFVTLAQMENLQLELLSNPLISILTGSIPYWDDRSAGGDDQYKLSNAGMMLFESLWYQMLQANSTSGIGIYMAPLENMRLESLAEAPNAMDIVSKGFTDTMAQAGLTALIPTSAEARAGAVNVSLLIESQFGKCIYRCYERMMNCLIDKLNLNYEFRFFMFGDLATDADREKALKEEMTLGLLPAAIEWNAMKDRSILDDIAWSDAIDESGLLERRKPLITSYNAKNPDSGLPPQGGRPPSDGVTSDGQEGDRDSDAHQDPAQ
jgi:hypothetical protein